MNLSMAFRTGNRNCLEVTTDSRVIRPSPLYVSATGEEDDWKRVGTANNGVNQNIQSRA